MTEDLLSIAADAVARARKLGADAAVASMGGGHSTDLEILNGEIEKLDASEGRESVFWSMSENRPPRHRVRFLPPMR